MHCRIHDIEAKYYADSEDAYDMRKVFSTSKDVKPARGDSSASTSSNSSKDKAGKAAGGQTGDDGILSSYTTTSLR